MLKVEKNCREKTFSLTELNTFKLCERKNTRREKFEPKYKFYIVLSVSKFFIKAEITFAFLYHSGKNRNQR